MLPKFVLRVILASFWNWNAPKSKIGQLSAYLTSCKKLGEEWAKCLSQNEAQSSSLKVEVLFYYKFLCFAVTICQRRLASKIEPQFYSFWPTVKFRGGVAKYFSEFYKFGLRSNLWYTFDEASLGRLED